MEAHWDDNLAPAEDIRWARAELSMLAGSLRLPTDDEQARHDLRDRRDRDALPTSSAT